MKKRAFRSLALALAMALLCSVALAEVRTTGNVWMRTGPGLDYEQIISFGEGKSLKYLGESSVDDRGVTWYKIKSGSTVGWVSSKYAKLKEGKAPSGGYSGEGSYVKISGGDANVRSGPGLDFMTIGTASEGTTLTYKGETRKDDRGVAWYAVDWGNRLAWVSSVYSVVY